MGNAFIDRWCTCKDADQQEGMNDLEDEECQGYIA